HEPHVGIAQPATEGTDRASVCTKRIAVVVLPENTFGNEAAPSWCYVGQASQFLHETAAESFNEDHKYVGSRGGKQRVLYVVGRFRIKSSENARAVFVGKIVIAHGIVITEANTADKGIDRIKR
ncbi:MAG: hypothetical protein IKD95_03025, partial [Bacteroidales bacterium]|nr:hypothetical protein [Bacteroidales bacterium]